MTIFRLRAVNGLNNPYQNEYGDYGYATGVIVYWGVIIVLILTCMLYGVRTYNLKTQPIYSSKIMAVNQFSLLKMKD